MLFSDIGLNGRYGRADCPTGIPSGNAEYTAT